jgi:hypothetical protein
MVKRPLKDKRPVGPIFTASESEPGDLNGSFPESVDRDELEEYKQNIERTADVEISLQGAFAIKQIDTPMLQSYIANVLGRASQHNDEVTVESVINSKATKKYARKVGAVQELEEARSVYD